MSVMLHRNLQLIPEGKTIYLVQIQFLKHFFGLFPFLNKHFEEGFLFTPEHFKIAPKERELLVLFKRGESEGFSPKISITTELHLELSKSLGTSTKITKFSFKLILCYFVQETQDS